jgi:hypothetical protein
VNGFSAEVLVVLDIGGRVVNEGEIKGVFASPVKDDV